MSDIPQKIPESTGLPYTLRVFRNLLSFQEFCNNIQVLHEKNNGGAYYDELLETVIADSTSGIKDKNTWYLGREPFPATYEEAMQRSRYQHMDEFNKYYEEYIVPEASKLLNESVADLDIPTFDYNDRELGFFDYNRASAALFSKHEYYSIKHKKYVDGYEVETFKEGNVYKYRLKSDKSPCAIVPQIEKGQNAEKIHKAFDEIYNGAEPITTLRKYDIKMSGFSTSIKKSYVHKEYKPKPKNSVRIFITLGGNAGVDAENLKWSGYLGVGLAQILEFLGYSVNINVMFGNYIYGGIKLKSGEYKSGHRIFNFSLKKFEETVDVSNLLYVLSDVTFFRIKFFTYIVKLAQFCQDYIDSGLGSTTDLHTMKTAALKEFAKIDPIFNKDGSRNMESPFLYYVVGNCYSEEAFFKQLREIILDVVNENKAARERSGFREVI